MNDRGSGCQEELPVFAAVRAPAWRRGGHPRRWRRAFTGDAARPARPV